MASFWETFKPAAPGLLSGGLGWYTGAMAEREAKKDAQQIGAAGAPFTAASLNQLNQFNNLDPQAAAKADYDARMGLVAPGQEAAQQAMMRSLAAKGMLGLGTHTPAAGLAPGQLHNPMMTSLLTAQNAANAQMSADAMDRGQRYLDNAMGRAATASNVAGQAQQNARGALPQVSSAAKWGGMLSGILGNKDTMGGIIKGGEWLFDKILKGSSAPSYTMPDFSLPSFNPVRYDFADDFGGYDTWGF